MPTKREYLLYGGLVVLALLIYFILLISALGDSYEALAFGMVAGLGIALLRVPVRTSSG
jgi:hypothetical protein